MKSRLLLLSLIVTLLQMQSNSQQPEKKYDAAWKKVEAAVNKGLPKSALDEVKLIYAMAKKENQQAQVIKSVIYMVQLQQENREDNQLTAIKEIEKEIAINKEPVTSIFKSLLATMYWGYFQQHRWQLYDRTKTANFKKEDIATWGVDDFHQKISSLYEQSLSDKKILQQTSLAAYDAIINKGTVRQLRPSLYDLLAHQALAYFQNDETYVTKPTYAFEINQPEAFNPAGEFIKLNFSTKDSLSNHHKALLIYQDLLAFHLKDANPQALIDVDLSRIQFINEKSTVTEKNKLYINALNHLTKEYKAEPAAAQAWFLLANYYHTEANSYQPLGDTTLRYGQLKAKEICEKVLQQKEQSEGYVNCFNLLNDIKRKELEFTVEKINVPGQPFRSLVSYKNIEKLQFRIIKATESLKKELANSYEDKIWNMLGAATPIVKWEQSLPQTNDFQNHSAEIKIEALPAGEYILVASSGNDFSDKNQAMGARLLYISNISYVNNGVDYFVLNRDNGQPLAKAAVQVWEQKYDYNTGKYTIEKAANTVTDGNGFFQLPISEKKATSNAQYTYLLDIQHQKDRLFLDDRLSNYYYNRNQPVEEPKPVNNIFLFTDRAIYRPGQIVYFKGIVLNRNLSVKKNQANPDFKTTIILRNANYKDIDTIKVSTNEYGSFSGKFQLPQSGLNGQFSIYTKKDGGYAGIKVEEYKRPKFYVDYEPIKGTYQVNDKITITGFAKAYAGNNIDGANVSYRVVRQPRFLYPWMFWRWWQPPANEMEIINGNITTDKDGKFKIEFSAIPDLTIDKKFEPVFDYTVYADITDLNGETRSGEKMVTVGYKSLMLATDVPSILSTENSSSISIRTQNMNGEYEPSVVTVTVNRLNEEKRLVRSRYWHRPDQFTMTKEQYIQLFPYDEYDNETDQKSWAKEKEVYCKKDSSNENGKWPINITQWPAGYYEMEIITKDKNGEEVKDIQYFEVTDQSKTITQPTYLWTGIQKTTVQPGETAKIEIGSSADNLFVVQQLDKSNIAYVQSKTDYTFLKLNNEKKTFSFAATEADRGGYGVAWMFVKHNRVYSYNQTINVPWTNKDLTIEYLTFRDKTLPGSEEKWKVKISGYKKEKVAAEMLATMYDASLDQFVPHNINQPRVWPTYYHRSNWDSRYNFTQVDATMRYINENDPKSYDKRYDQFIFGQANNYGGSYDDGAGMVMRSAAPMANRAEGVIALDSSVADEKDEYKKPIQELAKQAVQNAPEPKHEESGGDIKIRKNFNETAFFFPDLKTDSTGTIEFSFTMPEALTRWKFSALAHTKDAAFAQSTQEIVTQKDLMVQPNAPRFLREGDRMEFSSKIVNLTDKEITGTATFQLFDAETNTPVDGNFQNSVANQYFTVGAAQSEVVKFPIEVPYQFNKSLVWRVIAKATIPTNDGKDKTISDGEENFLPVLTNRMLVTETMPLPMRGNGTKNFSFEKLLKSGSSNTLQQHALTVEYTSNPAWYAVQALPYLMEYPYECAEQTWNKYYANSLATMIANSSPKIKAVFEKWKTLDTAALMSNLQKNQELKSILLEETPWVLQANNEAEQKRNIALLFDMIKMSNQLNSIYDKLKPMQSSNGGFVWFSGGPDDRYMTQYIVTSIGHLKKLKAIAKGQEEKLNAILATAIPYLDRKLKEDYDDLLKYKTNLKDYVPGYLTVQYLYMRSFFPEYKIATASVTAYNYFKDRSQKTWVSQSKYMQGMLSLTFNRTNDSKTANAILKSLKERAIVNDELGMYWKDQRYGWFWYEAPIETHALLIEAFQEVANDTKTVDDLRTWLLKNKQTNNWKTTKATAEACYALLLQGTDWLSNEPTVTIQLGSNTTIHSTDSKQEAGTGYFKQTIAGDKVKPEMGNISVTVGTSQISPAGNTGATWGGVYWQYFEDLDKITTAETPLKLSKKLFVEKNSDRGPVITPVNDGAIIKVGDKIKVRVELRVDRDMEYVHMKDMRASALEPVNVLSSYKWQGGLGYYESTKDASTNFFFNYLRKGTYVFEYTLFATHTGNFSNGVTTIQCMYAPEFTSHSEGVRINVE